MVASRSPNCCLEPVEGAGTLTDRNVGKSIPEDLAIRKLRLISVRSQMYRYRRVRSDSHDD